MHGTPAIDSAVMISAEPETHTQVCLHGDVRSSPVAIRPSSPGRISPIRRGWQRRIGTLAGECRWQLSSVAIRQCSLPPLPRCRRRSIRWDWRDFLRDKPLMRLPAAASTYSCRPKSDFIIEGWIDPADRYASGRQQFHRGRYSVGAGHDVYCDGGDAQGQPCLSGGVPAAATTNSAFGIGLMARLFLPYLKLQIPELVDLDLPVSGGARDLGGAVI